MVYEHLNLGKDQSVVCLERLAESTSDPTPDKNEIYFSMHEN